MGINHDSIDNKVNDVVEYARQIAAFQETIKITMQADIGGFGVYDIDSGDTILAGPSGRIGDNLLGLRIPRGKGLIGIVENKQTPVSIKSYINNRNIHHDDQVDLAVSCEGISSSAGAPIYKNNKIAGIVYAWRRNAMEFDKKDLLILGELADRFSKHYSKYNINKQSKVGKDDFIRYIDAFSEHNINLHNCYEQLFSTVLENSQMIDTIGTISSLLKHPIVLFDEEKKIKAQSENRIFKKELDYAKYINGVINEFQSKDSIQICFKELDKHGVLVPIRLGRAISGYLYIDGMEMPMNYSDSKLVLISSMVTGMHELRDKVANDIKQKYQGGIINSLVKGYLSERESLIEQCQRCGIDIISKKYRLVLIKNYNADNTIINWDLKNVTFHAKGLGSEIDRDYVALIEDEGHSQAVRTATEILKCIKNISQKAELLTIVTDPCGRLEDYNVKYIEASSFFKSVVKGDFKNKVISLEEIGLKRIFIQPANQDYLVSYVLDIFGPIMEYDEKKNSSLMLTLVEYFNCGCLRKETAQKMFIHIHTLDYRLRRIQEISKLNIDDSQMRFNIQMAIEAYKILKLTGRLESCAKKTGR